MLVANGEDIELVYPRQKNFRNSNPILAKNRVEFFV